MQLSNFPPGVTGTEPQIAGPTAERGVQRDCDADGVKLLVLDHEAFPRLAQLQMLLADVAAMTDLGALSPARMRVAVGHINALVLAINTHEVDTCGWEGPADVTVYGTGHDTCTEVWTCPRCGTEHEDEFTKDDYIDEDRYRDR